ncbi:MAG: hypothetical protein EOO39_06170 [Cytophagaceae bacterium]|nr:MAG: hypothetical protein EOO39_06170 [Cytophagaceae bacterium]
MQKLLLFLSLLSFISCQQNQDMPNDVAARASGRYTVQSYIVFGDTMYAINRINKIGVSDFYVIVDRKGPDSVRVGTFYTRKSLPIRFLKDVRVVETKGTFQLSANNYVPSGYEGKIDGNSFYERSVGGGLFIPPVDSSKNVYTSTSTGIVLTAQK